MYMFLWRNKKDLYKIYVLLFFLISPRKHMGTLEAPRASIEYPKCIFSWRNNKLSILFG